MSAEITRTCDVCKHDYPLTTAHWHRHPRKPAGLSATCKGCAIERARRNYRDNLVARRLQRKDYRAVTRFPGSRREEYQRGKDQILDYQHRYYAQNTEKVKGRVRDYQERNVEKLIEYRRKHYSENREIERARVRVWKASNPEKVRALNAAYRSRKKGALGTVTEADIIALFDIQRGACFYCHVGLANGYHVDHYMPLSRGGTSEFANLVLACPGCNCSKRNKLPTDFQRDLN